MVGRTYLDYIGLPEAYPRYAELADELGEALLEAAEEVMRSWTATDPLIAVMLDPRFGTWAWTEATLGDLPTGTEVRRGAWTGTTSSISAALRDYHPGQRLIGWHTGTGYAPTAYLPLDDTVTAWVPVPVDLSAATQTLGLEKMTARGAEV